MHASLSAVQQAGVALIFPGGFQACFPRGLGEIAGRLVKHAAPLGAAIVLTEPPP